MNYKLSNALEDAADAFLASTASPNEDVEWLAPTRSHAQFLSEELWSEVLPGLWQGGTDDDDLVYLTDRVVSITARDFDFVTTLYAHANPVDWHVQELRHGIWDGDMSDFDMEALLFVVRMTHTAWKSGKRTLIRCQAGWNRSGLVTALVMIMDGIPAREAIDLIREKRSPMALCNATFEKWLLEFNPQALHGNLTN